MRKLQLNLSPINQRRWESFKANRRGLWSLRIFLVMFLVTLCAEFIANDKPLILRYDGSLYAPVFFSYPETAFGGDFETEADYRDPYVKKLIEDKGWVLWPPIKYSYNTIN
ncbi:MAG: ABC transporter permease, partial [Pseudomonadota bacterium]|nr:ABC transporter permease [Pseudomonadota bacterium]